MRRNGERGRRQQGSGSGASPGEAHVVDNLEIPGDLGSHAVEALRLEIRRLARRCGLDVKALRIRTVGKEPSAKRL